jgi:hypothetical protein
MERGMIKISLISVIVFVVASAASAVTVYTSDPGWTYPEIADPSTDDITYFGWTQTGPGTWTPGNLIDNNTGTISGGRPAGGGVKLDYGSEVTAVGMYNKFQLYNSGTLSWTVELYDDGENVVLTESGSGSNTVEIWVDFEGSLDFQYEKVTMSGHDDWAYGTEFIYYTPEPATVAILGLGSLVLLRKRR